MRKLLTTMFVLGLLLSLAGAYASTGIEQGDISSPPDHKPSASTTTDDQCVIDFVHYTYGSWAGTLRWPGGHGTYRMTGLEFANSCTPDHHLFAYCIDLDDVLEYHPYCVDIHPLAVRPQYPEQYPALGYLMTWYPVLDNYDDMVMQLGIWKMSNDHRHHSSTHGVPFYYINDGRGYPSPLDPPMWPYVNTVYNSEPEINDTANVRVLHVLGIDDGIPKNVVMCGDQIQASLTGPSLIGDSAFVYVTVELVRGPQAAAVGNTSRSGVRLLFSIVNGHLNRTEGLTDANGQVQLIVSNPKYYPLGATLTICSSGLWPMGIIPCECHQSQDLIVQSLTSGAVCTICQDVYIPPDRWESAELVSFDAVVRPNGVGLMWRSASEENMDRWEIERRAARTGDFSVLARVAATNVPSGHAYDYTDATAAPGMLYEYRLADVDLAGVRTVHSEMTRTAGLPADAQGTLTGYALADNFPNPFNPETSIRFSLAEAGHVTLKVFDVTGKTVALLVNDDLGAGEHRARFDAGGLPSGVYFYELTSGSFSQTKKMVLMK